MRSDDSRDDIPNAATTATAAASQIIHVVRLMCASSTVRTPHSGSVGNPSSGSA